MPPSPETLYMHACLDMFLLAFLSASYLASQGSRTDPNDEPVLEKPSHVGTRLEKM